MAETIDTEAGRKRKQPYRHIISTPKGEKKPDMQQKMVTKQLLLQFTIKHCQELKGLQNFKINIH